MATSIERLGLPADALAGRTVIVTGAGGGIGFEAVRALLALGANAVVAEIDPALLAAAERALAAEFGAERLLVTACDVGDEDAVERLRAAVRARFGAVHAVINNATVAPLGAVTELPIADWDRSYRVNLRGPVLMAKAFLPGMVARGSGAFVCVSSTGAAFLGAYETFKAAQVHLATTLEAELAGTGVAALTIGPGLVPTRTANLAIERLAPRMGLTVEAFRAQNEAAMLSVEDAGAGFALAVLFAARFDGMEISSVQALEAAGQPAPLAAPAPAVADDAAALCARVLATLRAQSEGWTARSVFERQWVLRDFKRVAGAPATEWLERLAGLDAALRARSAPPVVPVERLAAYYDHLAELARGWEKDPVRREDSVRQVLAWRDDAARLARALGRPG